MSPLAPANSETWTHLILDADIATMEGEGLGVIRGGAIALAGDRIAWVGRRDDLPKPPDKLAPQTTSLPHRWITPGLIDPASALIQGWIHPHEAEETFALLMGEASEAARDKLAKLLRETEDEDLLKGAVGRLGAVLKEGVTVIGVSSAPAGDPETAIRLLRVARSLGDLFPITVRALLDVEAAPTGAERERLIRDAAAGDYADFIVAAPSDEGALATAEEQGLAVMRKSAECGGLTIPYTTQIGSSDAPRVAPIYAPLAGLGGHLEESGVRLAAEGDLAITTDFHPAAQPSCSLLLAMGVAARRRRLADAHVLRAVTINAAHVLGIQEEFGSIATGKRADFAAWDIPHLSALAHGLGFNPNVGVVRGGLPVQPLRPRIDG